MAQPRKHFLDVMSREDSHFDRQFAINRCQNQNQIAIFEAQFTSP
jgi:hypothetical protein